MATIRYATFKPETLQFLNDLSINNNRVWFNKNKSSYEEQLVEVSLAFIKSMKAPLEDIAPHFSAIPKRSGGSLMRIYRDTLIDEIKRKDFIAVKHMMLDDVLSSRVQQRVETAFRACADYMRFLCKAVSVPF